MGGETQEAEESGRLEGRVEGKDVGHVAMFMLAMCAFVCIGWPARTHIHSLTHTHAGCVAAPAGPRAKRHGEATALVAAVQQTHRGEQRHAQMARAREGESTARLFAALSPARADRTASWRLRLSVCARACLVVLCADSRRQHLEKQNSINQDENKEKKTQGDMRPANHWKEPRVEKR